jgi:hypothetical protein
LTPFLPIVTFRMNPAIGGILLQRRRQYALLRR